MPRGTGTPSSIARSTCRRVGRRTRPVWPRRQQAILGRGRWEADGLGDVVRDYALETLADPHAVLVLDETGFLKQGKSSCGVARQYTGSAGKITNSDVRRQHQSA